MSAPVDVALRVVYRVGRPLLASLFLAACGQSAPEGLEWRVAFACSGDALATEQLTVRVLKGGCDGERVLYESSFGRDGGAEAKTLGEGHFGLMAVAQSEAGVVAELCEEHELPSKQPIVLVLRAPGCTATLEDAGAEDAGDMDASESGAEDGALPADARTPVDATPADADAEPPCKPPKDCRPCAQDGNTSDCPPASCMEFSFAPHTYLFCSDKQEWAAARTLCRRQNRDLLVLDSMEENAFVLSHLGGTTHWMGANDRGENSINSCSKPIGGDEGTWRWVDPVSGEDRGVNFCNASSGSSSCSAASGLYMNWASGEPSNSGCNCIPFYKCDDGEDCGAINGSGSWLDSPCNSELPYVCESY